MAAIISEKTNPSSIDDFFAPVRPYKGRRIVLHKDVKTGEKESALLRLYDMSMQEERLPTQPALFQCSFEGKTIHLLGTCHAGLLTHDKVEAVMSKDARIIAEFIRERLHPKTKELISVSNTLYVEFDVWSSKKETRTRSFVSNVSCQYQALEKEYPAEKIINLRKKERENSHYLHTYGTELCLISFVATENLPVEVADLETEEEHTETLLAKHRWEIEIANALPSDKEAKESSSLSYYDLKDEIDAAEWGNMDSLSEINQSMSKEYCRDIITKRNYTMTSRIMDIFERNENALVAVGALHLAGDEGIVELLKKRGISIERVMLDDSDLS